MEGGGAFHIVFGLEWMTTNIVYFSVYLLLKTVTSYCISSERNQKFPRLGKESMQIVDDYM